MDYGQLRRWLFGAPLTAQAEEHQKLNVPLGLAVFSSDALSSTAYATDEILIALAASSFALNANLISLPVALCIVGLIALVVVSYRQIIRAYPNEGGAYVVARENLGVLPSHIAGAALLIDYVLTVSVSVAAGVAAITSTQLIPRSQAVPLALLFVLVLMIINLRGVKESGKAIAVPAYLFLVTMVLLIGIGLWTLYTHDVVFLPSLCRMEPMSWDWLLQAGFVMVFLKAFSHGCAGLTGIEAVSNGVQAFKSPAPRHANMTMTLMGVLLAGIFLGITFLAYGFHIVPSEQETILSQIARTVFGRETPLYYLVQLTTMVMLILAANTSFAGFPRISNLIANDGYLPRQLMNIGDRLVLKNGIVLLSVLSMALIVLYQGDTHALIPLYAVGVFTSFTLSQAGLVVHAYRRRSPGWWQTLLVTAQGALVTGVVTVLLAVEKFMEGAWIILVAIPTIMLVFRMIKRHYLSVAKQLALIGDEAYCPVGTDHTVLVLVSSLNRGTIPAVHYAKSISNRVEAVHIKLNEEGTQRLKAAWEKWGCDVPLTILDSPFRSIHEPLLAYIDEVEARDEDDLVTIILPEFVTKKWWHNLLHNQSAIMIKALLRQRKGKVVTTVRYYLDE